MSDDLFDDVIAFEERSIEQSRADGRSLGREQGQRDGFALGYKHGFALGAELSYYETFVRIVTSYENSVSERYKNCFSCAILLLIRHAQVSNDCSTTERSPSKL